MTKKVSQCSLIKASIMIKNNIMTKKFSQYYLIKASITVKI
jgi:hypothetical protein